MMIIIQLYNPYLVFCFVSENTLSLPLATGPQGSQSGMQGIELCARVKIGAARLARKLV